MMSHLTSKLILFELKDGMMQIFQIKGGAYILMRVPNKIVDDYFNCKQIHFRKVQAVISVVLGKGCQNAGKYG